MKTLLKWIAAFLLAGLAWLLVQTQAEYRWVHQKIPMQRRNG